MNNQNGTYDIVSMIIGFSVLQCIIVAFILIFRGKWNYSSSRWLVALLFIVSLTLVPIFFGHTGLIDKYHYLLFVPLDLSLFILPFLYFYINTLFQNEATQFTKIWGHLALPLLFWVYHLIVWIETIVVSGQVKKELATDWYYFSVQTWHQCVLLISIILYAFAIAMQIKSNTPGENSKRHFKFRRWSKLLLILFVLGAILDISAQATGTYYGYWKGSPMDDWLGISFSVLVKFYYAALAYGLALIGYSHFSEKKFSSRGIPGDQLQLLLAEVQLTMDRDKLFLDPNLTLSSLAQSVNTTPSKLSNLFNQEFKMPYNDFVNKYRVREVKKMMAAGDTKKFTLLALAQASGFKSKTTFYRAFQKFEGQSPRSYLQEAVFQET